MVGCSLSTSWRRHRLPRSTFQVYQSNGAWDAGAILAPCKGVMEATCLRRAATRMEPHAMECSPTIGLPRFKWRWTVAAHCSRDRTDVLCGTWWLRVMARFWTGAQAQTLTPYFFPRAQTEHCSVRGSGADASVRERSTFLGVALKSLQERSRPRFMDGLRKFIVVDNHEAVKVGELDKIVEFTIDFPDELTLRADEAGALRTFIDTTTVGDKKDWSHRSWMRSGTPSARPSSKGSRDQNGKQCTRSM